MTSFLGDDLIV
ncbi:hypothetical protein AYI70_g10810, partial [Smittium culicis]